MRRLLRQGAALILVAVAQVALAHPAPFSYLDLHLADSGASGTLVIHDFDAAHELGLAEPQALLAPSVASAHAGELTRLVDMRLSVRLDAELATLRWRPVEVLPEQQSLRFGFTIDRAGAPGHIEIDAALFPYDANHQTFINVYEDSTLRQQLILDASHQEAEYYSGSVQGRLAVVKTSAPIRRAS